MTPQQHKVKAEAFLTRVTDSPWSARVTDLNMAEVHSLLAAAAGSGTHYDTAEELLAGAEASYTAAAVDRAKLHALLADR